MRLGASSSFFLPTGRCAPVAVGRRVCRVPAGEFRADENLISVVGEAAAEAGASLVITACRVVGSFSRASVPGGMSRSEEVSGRGAAQVAPLLVHSRSFLLARRWAGSPGCVCHCWGGVTGSPSASSSFPTKKNLRRRSVRGECASPLGVNSNTGRGGARLESGPLRRPSPFPRVRRLDPYAR